MSSLRTCYLILPTVLAAVAFALLIITFLDQIYASSPLLSSLYFLKLDTSSLSLPGTGTQAQVVSTIVSTTVADEYTVGLWNFCSTAKNGTRSCSPPEFGYYFNPIEAWGVQQPIANTAEALLPETWEKGLATYRTASKWMFIAYLAAVIASLVVILMGLIACSLGRLSACCTAIFAWIAALLSIAASGTATALFIVVKGILEKELGQYNLKVELGNKLLTYSWIGSGFALGAAVTWMFGCCCSKNRSDKRSSRGWNKDIDYQPLVGGAHHKGHHHGNSHEAFPMQQRQWPGQYSYGQTAYQPVHGQERV